MIVLVLLSPYSRNLHAVPLTIYIVILWATRRILHCIYLQLSPVNECLVTKVLISVLSNLALIVPTEDYNLEPVLLYYA